VRAVCDRELEAGVGQRCEAVAAIAGVAGDGDLLDERIGDGARPASTPPFAYASRAGVTSSSVIMPTFN
jgi:hypothetical protein